MYRPIDVTTRNRWRALFLLCAGQLMIILDGTIVSAALPAIQTDLGFTQSSLTWAVNAYLIPFAGLLLLAGRLGDLLGRRRMFLGGMLLFTAASLLCGLAGSQLLLVAARFLQGVGGAMGSAVIVVLAARTLVADEGAGLRAGADVVGAILVTAGLMLTVYTLVTVTDHGWGSAHTIGYGVLALGLLAGFVLRQATARTPLLPLRIFRLRNLTGGNLTQVSWWPGCSGSSSSGPSTCSGCSASARWSPGSRSCRSRSSSRPARSGCPPG